MITLKLALFLLIVILVGVSALTAIATSYFFRRRYRRKIWEDGIAQWQRFPLGVLILDEKQTLLFANVPAKKWGGDSAESLTHAIAPVFDRWETTPQRLSFAPTGENRIEAWHDRWGNHHIVVLIDGYAMKQREREMQQFWGGLSHELRTPLTSALSHLEVVRLEGASAEVQRFSINIIHQQLVRLTDLVQNALAFSRLRYLPIERSPLNLILIIEEVVIEMLITADQRQIEIDFNYPAFLPRVLGHADRLRQLLINLLDNAIKYANQGSVIDLNVRQEGDRVVCQFYNRGEGIPAEQLPYLMEPFFRGRRDLVGSGLGLAISAEIVRQHDGTITVTSQTEGEETGTTVTFSLPLLQGMR